MKIIILASICFLQLSFISVFAQQAFDTESETQEYNRWSASLYGGYVFGEKDNGVQLFASSFNVVSEPSWAVGGDLRYSLNSFWSIEGGYRYTTLEGRGFETNMHTASLKNTFNFNRFYRRSSLAEVLNPYAILGIEQDFYNAQGTNSEATGSEASLIGGAGLAFRLSNRFEIYGQHELKLSSNRLDLVDQGYPYDQIGMSSGGVRVYFGSSNKRPMNLNPPTRTITDREYDNIFASIRAVDQLKKRADSLENQLEINNQENENKYDELFDRIAFLEAQIDSLENNQHESLDDQLLAESERDLKRTVGPGHYVQVYASHAFENAFKVRQQFKELLKEDLNDPDEEIFIIHRKKFFEVMIGAFDQISKAQRILVPSSNKMEDSFIISFYRPVHLENLYDGTVIVHE